MRLRGLSTEIIFDEFEEYPLITLNVFISSMFNMEMLDIPEYFPVKIYTSKIICKQMRTYWQQKKENPLKLHKFVILQPNVPAKVPLYLSHGVEVCMFESDDVNKNVMFMFRAGNKVTHVYAGMVTKFSCLLSNNVFKNWTLDGVCDLYVDVSRAMCLDECDPKLNNAINSIEEILESNPDHTLMVNMPKFGYENFVYNLAERLRGCVSIGGIMFAVFIILNKMEYFAPNTKDAKILIVNKSFTLEEMQSSYQRHKNIFIKITDILKCVETKKTQLERSFIELNWSPLPSRSDLQLLAKIVKPNRIYPIHHDSYASQLPPHVPNYLLQLCKDYAQIIDEVRKSKNFEEQVLEDIFSTKSSGEFSSESPLNEYAMKLTQDTNAISEVERAKRVCDWLFAENVSNCSLESEQESTISEPSIACVHVNEVIKTNRRISKTKICSRTSNSLKQAQLSSKSPKPSNDETFKNSFYIPKRSIHYLENSDSSS